MMVLAPADPVNVSLNCEPVRFSNPVKVSEPAPTVFCEKELPGWLKF